MNLSLILLILILLISTSVCQYGKKFTEEEIQIILKLHNEARAEITDSVTPLKPMQWNHSLETTAFKWAGRCTRSHNSKHGRATVGFHRVGENIGGQSKL